MVSSIHCPASLLFQGSEVRPRTYVIVHSCVFQNIGSLGPLPKKCLLCWHHQHHLHHLWFHRDRSCDSGCYPHPLPYISRHDWWPVKSHCKVGTKWTEELRRKECVSIHWVVFFFWEQVDKSIQLLCYFVTMLLHCISLWYLVEIVMSCVNNYEIVIFTLDGSIIVVTTFETSFINN